MIKFAWKVHGNGWIGLARRGKKGWGTERRYGKFKVIVNEAGGEETVRVRNNEEFGVLPVPPSLDVTKLRKRYEKRYRKECTDMVKEEEISKFSAEIRNNAFARMLAQPVRYCRFTQHRLPRSLLLEFDVREMETDEHNGKYIQVELNTRRWRCSDTSKGVNRATRKTLTRCVGTRSIVRMSVDGIKAGNLMIHAHPKLDSLLGASDRILVKDEETISNIIRKTAGVHLRQLIQQGTINGRVIRIGIDEKWESIVKRDDLACIIIMKSGKWRDKILQITKELNNSIRQVEKLAIKLSRLMHEMYRTSKSNKTIIKVNGDKALNIGLAPSTMITRTSLWFGQLEMDEKTCVPVYKLPELLGDEMSEELARRITNSKKISFAILSSEVGSPFHECLIGLENYFAESM